MSNDCSFVSVILRHPKKKKRKQTCTSPKSNMEGISLNKSRVTETVELAWDIWIRIFTQKNRISSTEMRPWNRAGEQWQGNLSADDDGEAMEIEKKCWESNQQLPCKIKGHYEFRIGFLFMCLFALWKCTSNLI